jgi:hypothetical protein
MKTLLPENNPKKEEEKRKELEETNQFRIQSFGTRTSQYSNIKKI